MPVKKIKGIILDKDGTVIDFKSLWLPWAIQFVHELLITLDEPGGSALEAELLSSIGVERDQETINPHGTLATGTYFEIANAIHKVLPPSHNLDSTEILFKLKRVRDNLMHNSKGLIKPASQHGEKYNVRALFEKLRLRDLKIGMVTADDMDFTKHCLDTLRIFDCFCCIFSGDSHCLPKPSSSAFLEFCQINNLLADEVAVIGDTPIDIQFARKAQAGLMIGVLSGVSDRSTLRDADWLIPSINSLVTERGKLLWEQSNERLTKSLEEDANTLLPGANHQEFEA